MLVGVGFLSATHSSSAAAISADGTTVVGSSRGSSGLDEAFRWTATGGIQGLGALGGESYAYAVSADGSTVVGMASDDTVATYYATRWTQALGLQSVYGGCSSVDVCAAVANDVSSDGSLLVGGWFAPGASGWQALRLGGASPLLGDLPGGAFGSRAYGVSADGSVVVGYGTGASGTEAFRWSAGTGMVGLGDLAGGAFRSTAFDVSADGSVIVGESYGASGKEAFRWTASGGMVGLGDLAGGAFASSATGVSADGTRVVGVARDATGNRAFLWDPVNGMRALDQVLASLGVDVSGWTLLDATGISADGRTIVGEGIDPNGFYQGWVASLPEPGAGLLVALAAAAFGVRRRA